MTIIEWKDDYKTGFKSIDYEHETLIVAINGLYEHAAANDNKKIAAALGEIHILIESHFALEEKVMRDQNYPDYVGHKNDHDRLLDEILDIMDAAEVEDPDATGTRLGERLSNWFGTHFSTYDRDLHGKL
ncbi:MAG: hemerythrin family protein [Rhodospirillaceae bacterium]|jgi:hemerythrin|nr:hemerythrin family protein [Rhodospirillaceae bacterium]MBT4219380.1 hemerythrin family protein [Rhodospirillaceae bacterium]MBT4464292.1 hemerythrin family protein [Rhodospirillaceae bacterium]MBT5014078.1 hemerythrin family protein [Rhodospirillaceae bacterium]MBT5308707.1 hemerythrin family protein [Rhodospirillaceae bacterium]